MSFNFTWQSIPSSATDIGVGQDGDCWIIGTNSSVFQWTGSAWSEIEATGRAIAVTPTGVMWLLGLDGWVYRCDKGTWTRFVPPIPSKDIAVDPSGVVWLVSDNNLIFKQVGDSFEPFDGSALRIAVGLDGRPWIVGTDERIWHHNGQNWITFPPLTGCRDIGVGADGSVYAIDNTQQVLRLDLATNTWTATDIRGTRLCVATNGLLSVVRLDGTVVRQRKVDVFLPDRDAVADACWQQNSNGLARDIAVGPEGTVWVVGTDWQAWCYRGYDWKAIDCVARRIAVGTNDTVWIVGSSETGIWRRDTNGWTKVFDVPSNALDLAVGPSGAVFVATTTNREIYRWKDGALTKIPGGAQRLAVDGNDDLWVIGGGDDRPVFRHAGGQWLRIAPPGGGAVDIGVGVDGSVWVTALDGRVYRLDVARTGWILTSQTGTNISVGPDGNAWVSRDGDWHIFNTTSSYRSNTSRDFVTGLFWRYLGRTPDVGGLNYHQTRLLNRSATRTSLDAEFAACEEARKHRAYSDHDFVNYLSWRYLGQALLPDQLEHHFNRLFTGQMTRDALENEFRTCSGAVQYGQTLLPHFVIAEYYRYLGRPPSSAELTRDTNPVRTFDQIDADLRNCREAQDHAHLQDRDFVSYLSWRYLGRDPGGWFHYYRLLDATTTRDALEAEFATCPEASAYLPTHAPLVILGAAYSGAKPGQEDVTARIRSWVSEKQLLAGWTPTDLGAEGNGDGHVLVIVYRYGNGPARTRTFATGKVIEIQPDTADRMDAPAITPHVRPEALTILGAAYGRSIVTRIAQGKAANDRLYIDATDAEWGYAGPFTSSRALVVVYQVGSGPPIVHMTQNGKRAFVNAPPLQILGATFGNVDITAALAAQVRGGMLEVYVDWQIYGSDPWPGVWKSVVVAYRYGDETQPVQIIAQREQNLLTITPTTTSTPDATANDANSSFGTTVVSNGPFNTLFGSDAPGLQILAAAYGVTNVTKRAKSRVSSDILNVRADNATWGDGWYGNAKSFVVVYRIDGGRPLVRVVREDEWLVLAAPRIIAAAWGPLDVTDRVATMVRGGTLSFDAKRELFGDALIGQTLSMTVVYDYHGEMPQIAVVGEGATLTLSTTRPEASLPTTTGVQILAATFGLWDVTAQLRRSQRNFLRSLCTRYIGRDPNDPEFNFHLHRLIIGEISEIAMDSEFATCPEALGVGPVTDTAFVKSLYWRYLGREAEPAGLAGHVSRLSQPGNTRDTLDAEFRSCPEAMNYTATQSITASTSLLPGINVTAPWSSVRKTLAVVYRLGSGPARLLTALEGETLVLNNAESSVGSGQSCVAHIITQVRALQDYLLAPPIVTVTAPGVVVPADNPAVVMPPPNELAANMQPCKVHQVVVVPRDENGKNAPEGTHLTVVCGEPVDLLTDQPGRTMLYRLSPHVPINIVVPASGRCRFSIAVGDKLVAPLLRVRWSSMPTDVWAVIAPDQHLQTSLANLKPGDWLNPGEGKTSPIASYEVGRAYALQAALGQVMGACGATELRTRAGDGGLRVLRPFNVGPVAAPADSEFVLPQHARIQGNAVLSRALITGATSLYAKRKDPKGGFVIASIFDDIADAFGSAFGSVGRAFKSGFDAISSALTVAFNATIGGVETAFRGTVESMQSLVTVADKLATTIDSFTASTYQNAQCVLLDATNGLVAFAVSISNGVLQVYRTAITTLEDIALLVADTLRRVALEVKDIVEFVIMFLFTSWGDILETQRYLADAINTELDAFAGLSNTASDSLRAVFGDVITMLGLDSNNTPSLSLSNPATAVTSALGDAFSFLFDRVEGALSLFPSPSVPSDPGLGSVMQTLHDTLGSQRTAMGAIDVSAFATITDPRQLIGLLKNVVRDVLIALRDNMGTALTILGRAGSLIKTILNQRLYIPGVTELIEIFIFHKKSDLSIMSLVTLMSGAAYTCIYKVAKLSAHGPFHDEPQGQSVLATIRLSGTAPAPTTTDASTTLACKVDPPVVTTQSAGRSDTLNQKLALGISLTGGVAAIMGVWFKRATSRRMLGSCLSILSSACGLTANTINRSAFGRWWPAELTVNSCNLICSVVDYGMVTYLPGVWGTKHLLGAAQVPTAIVSGIGQSIDGVLPSHVIALRTIGSVYSGGAEMLDTTLTQNDRMVCLVVSYSCRLGLAVDGMVTALS